MELTGGERKVLSEVLRLRSATMTDKEILDTIFLVEKEFSYIIDPHTAVAVGACLSDEGSPDKVPRVCMGCAHPMKFLPTVAATFGCSREQAFVMASGAPGHRCVEAVGEIARSARDGYPSADWVPPGCCAVLRKTADWEAEWTAAVRAKVEALSARAAHGVALRSQL